MCTHILLSLCTGKQPSASFSWPQQQRLVQFLGQVLSRQMISTAAATADLYSCASFASANAFMQSWAVCTAGLI